MLYDDSMYYLSVLYFSDDVKLVCRDCVDDEHWGDPQYIEPIWNYDRAAWPGIQCEKCGIVWNYMTMVTPAEGKRTATLSLGIIRRRPYSMSLWIDTNGIVFEYKTSVNAKCELCKDYIKLDAFYNDEKEMYLCADHYEIYS